MADRIKQLMDKVLEWWNKFSTKQKTFIVAAGAGIILTIAILSSVLMRPQYVELIRCETPKEASEVKDLLIEQQINYTITNDGLYIQVSKSQEADARLLLAANDIQSSAYGIENVTNGGFSTTESDKQKKYELYMETRLANDLLSKFTSVKTAVVDLYIPENDGTLIAKEQESSAWILLELKDEFSSDSAAFVAKAVSRTLGNKTDENIDIMDTEGNMLFSGGDSYSLSGTASSQIGVKKQYENLIKNEVKQVLLGTNEFNKIEVASNLVIDFSSIKQTDHEYYVPEGNTQGYLSHERTYSEESNNSGGGVPGTDPNGNTEYEYQDTTDSNSAVLEEERDYLPGEKITDSETPPGAIVYANSSIAAACTKFNIIREEDAKSQGLLDGVTWQEYKLANKERTKLEVDTDLISVVARATGIPADNIELIAYQENVFYDREGLNVETSDIIQIVLILVILGLLAFVVLRSMRAEKEAQQPEELSVETLLQSQPDIDLEDFGTEQISENRRMIDKFVEDNPEAAANLLRNWLNEEWG